MKVPSEFDSIRPYEPEELPEVYDKLLADEQFQHILAYVYPNVPMETIGKKMHACKTNLDFQRAFCYPILQKLIIEQSTGIDMDIFNIDIHNRYTFVSNHRDIVLDSAFLDKLLLDTGFSTTCEIAIGDNLLQLDWIKALARINKTFTVERALKSSEMLRASKRMSEYMHFAIAQKHENVWIAQRQGRAKNSNDLTQSAILKMMAMGGEGTIIDRLTQLHIVPLSISYQYDPCDYLKAREFQLRRDLPYWKKSPGDDLESMNVGIRGYKGHIHYCCAPCIDEWLQTVDQDQPRNKMFDQIAEHIDHEIHCNYHLYPQNYVALDMIQNTKMYTDNYTQEEYDKFEEYIISRLALINIDHKDEAYLRRCLLTQYAYPTRNYLTATESTGRLKQFFSKFNFTK
ncbi:acyltransferase [Hallella multisaccharivorax DSM 17128]|uniref:Acyltransferase family protein n=1 Tax=Hallella multisaccharivorax DSM 17128 TaxID=688246 RepID=F8N726_9BACT|nr:1-acyl-sn-glycerol-3-phosphate acyltransferase [Hallella multisaccharivorax]EGN56324.1 acyltransferase family protein [Hallella multisaccharivorax DSM 17128]GJG29837.1 acyltransferase [Hallella multisaccharivorax DSM 17128]